MAGTSIGGSPPGGYGKWIERDYQNEERNKALAGRVRGAQSKAADAELGKYQHDLEIDNSKVHRWDEPLARKNGDEMMAKLFEAKQKYGDENFLNYARQIAQPYLDNQKEFVAHKQMLDKAYADADAMEKANGATPEIVAAKKALQVGSPDDLQQDVYGNVEHSKNERGLHNVSVNMYPKVDWNTAMDAALSKQKLDMREQAVNNPNLQPGEKAYAVSQGNFRTQAEADAFAEKIGRPKGSYLGNETVIANYVQSPTHFRSAEQEVRGQLENDYPDYGKLSHKDRVDAVTKEMQGKYGGYGAVTYNYKADKAPAVSTGRTKSGGFQSETFSIEPTQVSVAGKNYGGAGYAIRTRGNTTENPKRDFSAAYALDADGKKVTEGKGVFQGAATAVVPMINPDTKQAEYYVKLTQPEYKSGSVTTIDPKTGTSTNKPKEMKADAIYIPYNDADGDVAASIKAITKPKKGDKEGWGLTKEDMQKLDIINKDLTGGGSSAKPKVTDSDPRIDNFMKANKITDRNEAIKILKENKIID